MKDNYSYSKFKNIALFLAKIKIPSKVTFIVIGILSTLWFLIRVIPKPQRATYPCMKATAPWASAFIIYLLSLSTSAFSFKRFRQNVSNSKYKVALGFLMLSVFSALVLIPLNPSEAFSASKVTEGAALEDPNTPMGTARGIFPGRVVWVFDTAATNENCTNNYGDGYFLDKNTNQDVVDDMVKDAVLKITGEKNVKDAWDAIFKYHNAELGKGEVSYQSGEIIFLKINATSSWGGNFSTSDLSRSNNNSYAISETSPQLVTTVLRHLVNEVGVSQSDIYIGDPMKHIYKDNYEKWHNEFPDVHYLDNSYSTLGREKVSKSTTAIIDYSDRGTVLKAGSLEDATFGDPVDTDYLYTIFEDMEYMINLPTMKGHIRAGVTMFAKNHFGSQTRDNASHLHGGLVKISGDPLENRDEYGVYRVQVDLMGHELLGKKNLIYLMDALYSSDFEIDQPDKFEKAPWNNDWSSSIFISQDPVAIESVGFDILYFEFDGTNSYHNYPHYGAVDDYLHQAADEANWPSGITYDPENDGSKIGSLGVHEHWNNSTDMQYSVNLGTGNGIELVKIFRNESQLPEIITAENSELPSNQVNTIFVDSSNTLWVGTDAGLSCLSDSGWKHYDTSLFNPIVNDIKYERTSHGKELWIATDSGLTVASYNDIDGITGSTTYVPGNSELVGYKVAAVDVDIFHNRWIGTDSAINVFKGSGWDSKFMGTDAMGDYFVFTDVNITDIESYAHDSLTLIATDGKGIVRMKYNDIDGFTGASTYAQPWATLNSDTITAIDVDNELQWYGTNMGAQKHPDNKTKSDWILFNTESGLLDNYINTVHMDKAGNAWIGTSKGISIVLPDEGVYKLTEEEGLINNKVNCITSDTDGKIWVATSGGIQWFEGLTGEVIILGKPVLVSPEDFEPDVEVSVTLSWDGVINATAYDLEVADSVDFSNIIESESDITGTSFSLTGLDAETNYYWRVKAKNSNLTGDWSTIFMFTTKHINSINPLSYNNQIVIYPNPASNYVNLKINSSENQSAAIRLYSIQGRLIENFRNIDIVEGTKTIRLDMSDKSRFLPGVYILRITNEKFDQSIKLNIN